MIQLKRYGASRQMYVYVRPSAVVALSGDDTMVEVELEGREDPFRVEGPLEVVAARLGLSLTKY